MRCSVRKFEPCPRNGGSTVVGSAESAFCCDLNVVLCAHVVLDDAFPLFAHPPKPVPPTDSAGWFFEAFSRRDAVPGTLKKQMG